MPTNYDKIRLIRLAQDHFLGRNMSAYLAMELSILHRFLKLSDAYCLLRENDNIESAQQLLRMMLDCIMRLIAINIVDDPEGLCRQIIIDRKQFDNIEVTVPGYKEGKKVFLKEKTLLEIIVCFQFIKGVRALYERLCGLIHTSYYHVAHLVADNTEEFVIGGSRCAGYDPIVESSDSDFYFLQDTFYNALKLS